MKKVLLPEQKLSNEKSVITRTKVLKIPFAITTDVSKRNDKPSKTAINTLPCPPSLISQMNPVKLPFTFTFTRGYCTVLLCFDVLRCCILLFRSGYQRADWMKDFPAQFVRDGGYHYFHNQVSLLKKP